MKILAPAAFSILLAAAGAPLPGCSESPDEKEGNTIPKSTEDAIRVMDAHVGELMAIPGVTAVAVGALGDGKPCIMVYIVKKTGSHEGLIPKEIEGYPVVVEESGEIRPMPDEGKA